ncbi:MAG: hypothetical protein HYR75_02930 [Gemmatimonadetes bacterium]|nr:hypothetical protein [Gemmatimonadota bacterium]MBI3569193.1 hypothetical protein [Gemmatimonadota bacterium]
MAAPFRPLALIRTAMVAGVVVLAVGSYLVRRRALVEPPPGDTSPMLRTMALVAAGIAAAALVALRVRSGSADAARRPTFTVLAWAAGEFAALAGLAAYLLTGVQGAAAPGLLVFALAMVMFPPPRA